MRARESVTWFWPNFRDHTGSGASQYLYNVCGFHTATRDILRTQ
jgi:hypothetical protein